MKPTIGTWTPIDGSAARIVTGTDALNVTYHYPGDDVCRQTSLREWDSWVEITRASLTPPLLWKP